MPDAEVARFDELSGALLPVADRVRDLVDWLLPLVVEFSPVAEFPPVAELPRVIEGSRVVELPLVVEGALAVEGVPVVGSVLVVELPLVAAELLLVNERALLSTDRLRVAELPLFPSDPREVDPDAVEIVLSLASEGGLALCGILESQFMIVERLLLSLDALRLPLALTELFILLDLSDSGATTC